MKDKCRNCGAKTNKYGNCEFCGFVGKDLDVCHTCGKDCGGSTICAEALADLLDDRPATNTVSDWRDDLIKSLELTLDAQLAENKRLREALEQIEKADCSPSEWNDLNQEVWEIALVALKDCNGR